MALPSSGSAGSLGLSADEKAPGSADSLSADLKALKVDEYDERYEYAPFFYAPLGITIRRPHLRSFANSVPDDSSVTSERPPLSPDDSSAPDRKLLPCVAYKIPDDGEKKTCPCMARRGNRENRPPPKRRLILEPYRALGSRGSKDEEPSSLP